MMSDSPLHKKTIFIQARLSSTRFPQKMLMLLQGIPLIEYVYKRCKESKQADNVVILTSKEQSDQPLFDFCTQKAIPVFRGELSDVLKRYIEAGNYYQTHFIARVCGDSPFVDIHTLDKMFEIITSKPELEYLTLKNVLNGFLSEVFTLNLLKKIYNPKLSADDKEHVTKYIRDNSSRFNTEQLDVDLRPKHLEKFSLTIDYEDDQQVAQKIASALNSFSFTSKEVIEILYKI